ncbi:MAG: CBS domain-containing protein [Nanoarchaeota archaeon]|nr:CBS domain-containing protein [Nanoarchaeota archaeon]
MIKAKTIMTENVITINESATITEAAKLMVNKHVKSLLVTKNNKPIAIVTENSLIKGALNKSPNKVKIKDVMSKEFLIVNTNTSYSYIIKKLREEKIKRFPVVENDKLIGIITETDIVDATRDFTRFHQIMQEIILVVFGLVTAFFLFFFSPLGQSVFVG